MISAVLVLQTLTLHAFQFWEESTKRNLKEVDLGFWFSLSIEHATLTLVPKDIWLDESRFWFGDGLYGPPRGRGPPTVTF